MPDQFFVYQRLINWTWHLFRNGIYFFVVVAIVVLAFYFFLFLFFAVIAAVVCLFVCLFASFRLIMSYVHDPHEFLTWNKSAYLQTVNVLMVL